MGARSTQGRGPGLNKTDGHLLKYLRDSFTAGGGAGITDPPSGSNAASGGDQVVDYNGYRIHVFKTTGNSTFTVTNPVSAYVMAVGGGGGGTSMRGAGSGAGGCVLRDPGHPNGLLQFSPGSWTITVGAGGAGGNGGFSNANNAAQGTNGEDTVIDSPSTLIAGGGAAGAGGWSGHTGIAAQSSPHGSGGGGGESSSTAGTGNSSSPAPIYAKGTPGGGTGTNGGAGGGGWNTKGVDGAGGDGGLGRQIPSIFRSPQITGVGTPGPNGEEWWVGGGGGGYGDGTDGAGGGGGGGDGNGTGPEHTGPIAGRPGTGGGGGGAAQSITGGTGGPGFVLIAYQIN